MPPRNEPISTITGRTRSEEEALQSRGLQKLRAVQDMLVKGALEIAPGSGEVLSAAESVKSADIGFRNLKTGKYLDAARNYAESVVAGIGALPVIGEGMRITSEIAQQIPDLARYAPGFGMTVFSRSGAKFKPNIKNKIASVEERVVAKEFELDDFGNPLTETQFTFKDAAGKEIAEAKVDITDDVADLSWIEAKGEKRQGIGSEALQQTEQMLADRGVKKITLTAAKDKATKEPTAPFYKKYGYETKFAVEGDESPMMEKVIGSEGL